MSKHYPGTPKAWAAERGLCGTGRGRPSKAAMDAIAAAIADGWTFGGGSVVVNKSAEPTGPVVEKPKDDSPKGEAEGVNVYADAFYRYDREQKFYYEHEGKRHECSGRTACMGCGYSLIGHTCNEMVGLTKHGQKVIKPLGE